MEASQEHAFEVWANRPSLWWPRSHTVTGGDALSIIFEGRPGGRIYERAADGTEHEWGQVTAWEPPDRIAYSWHLFFDPAEATDVEVTFAAGPDQTIVRIEQRGWERLGEAGQVRRANTEMAWAAIVPRYVAACR